MSSLPIALEDDMATTYTLYTGQKVQARPGQMIRCSAIGNNVRILDRISDGLGFTFRCQPDGTLTRVFF
jgi:hypothetical protein